MKVHSALSMKIPRFMEKTQCSKLTPALWISPAFQKHHMEARFGMKGKRTNTCHPG